MSISDSGKPDHLPVLLEEVVAGLNIRADGFYVDATLGRGGHSAAILQRLSGQGRMLLLDRDPTAVAVARKRFQQDARVTVVQSPFSELDSIVQQQGGERLDGLLLDLGVSSPQLDEPHRGFSFMQDGPLDMRMNPQQGESAAAWLQREEQQEIARVLWEYGEERHSRRIARAIVDCRATTELTTTQQLAELIKRVIPGHSKRHPATKSFQAIRIHINHELGELRQVLEQSAQLLAPQGRLAIISFHSLEDRMVKRFLKQSATRQKELPADIPMRSETIPGVFKTIGKAQFAGVEELQRNPRARSAVLRIAERLNGEEVHGE